MKTCHFLFRSVRLRAYALILLAAGISIAPRPAYALFGVGDIVHDPLMFSGMLGQTGAQIAQLIQTYYVMVEMRERYGSLTKLKSWRALLRNYAYRSLQNLGRQVVYDIQRRGARISSETPTNPVLSAMITGRRKLAEMEDHFIRADALSGAYSRSDWSIAKLDYEQQQRERERRLDESMAQQQTRASLPPAIAGTPAAFGDGAAATGSTSTFGKTNTAEETAALSRQLQPTVGSTESEEQRIAARVELSHDPDGDQYRSNAALIVPEAGDGRTATQFKLDGSAESQAMLRKGIALASAAALQEMDAAIQYSDSAAKDIEKSRELIDQADMKGPEPYLSHMTMQNDTIIGIMRLQLRAARAIEEREQMRATAEDLRADGESYQDIQSHLRAVNGVKEALKQ